MSGYLFVNALGKKEMPFPIREFVNQWCDDHNIKDCTFSENFEDAVISLQEILKENIDNLNKETLSKKYPELNDIVNRMEHNLTLTDWIEFILSKYFSFEMNSCDVKNNTFNLKEMKRINNNYSV